MAAITASDVRTRGWTPGLSGTGQDTLLGTLIATAEDRLARWCGFQPASVGGAAGFEDASIVLYLDGPGGDVLSLPFGPIVSITSVYDDPLRAYGASTLVASTDYEAWNNQGPQIILLPTSIHGAWSTSPRAIKATVVLGFTTIPDAVKDAIGMTVGHWFKVRERLGNESSSAGGHSVSLRPERVPEAALEMLAPYRHWQGGFG